MSTTEPPESAIPAVSSRDVTIGKALVLSLVLGQGYSLIERPASAEETSKMIATEIDSNNEKRDLQQEIRMIKLRDDLVAKIGAQITASGCKVPVVEGSGKDKVAP